MTLIWRGIRDGSCQSCALARRWREKKLAADPLAESLRETGCYASWTNMWHRCTNPNATNWAYYGGRGITVCERWKSFEAFAADMGPSYRDGLTLDRIDSDGPYSPENCRWATMEEQNVNKRSNRLVTFQGRTQTISQWASELGMNYFALRTRFDKGWTPERALTTPIDVTKRNGKARMRAAREPGHHADSLNMSLITIGN